jgi:serine protease Do
LPTPDGYVGMACVMPGTLQDLQAEQLKFIADYLYLTYRGTLPQWQAFLARRELRPAVFEHLKMQYSPGAPLRLQSPRMQLDTTGLVTLDAKSSLDLQMNYIVDHGKAEWDVAGVMLRPDRDKKSYLAFFRQSRPAEDATKARRERWEHMSQRDGDFAGKLQHDDALSEFWIRTVAGGSGAADPLYEVVYNTDRQMLPRDMEEIRARLPASFKITE